MKTFFGGIFIQKEKLMEEGIDYPIKLEYYKYKCEANNKEIYLYIAKNCGDVREEYCYRRYNTYISMRWKNNINLKYELIHDRSYFIEKKKYLEE